MCHRHKYYSTKARRIMGYKGESVDFNHLAPGPRRFLLRSAASCVLGSATMRPHPADPRLSAEGGLFVIIYIRSLRGFPFDVVYSIIDYCFLGDGKNLNDPFAETGWRVFGLCEYSCHFQASLDAILKTE